MGPLWLVVLVLFLSTGRVTPLRLYPYLLDPRENPDYERYPVSHPTHDVFGTVPQFATLRYFPIEDSKIVNYTELIDIYCLDPNTTLGKILWPYPSFLFANNSAEFIDYVASKNLYITSVHGFTPVNAGYRPPEEVMEYLEQKLGSHWFGIANGEQDGHYFDAFIRQELPQNIDRHDQYLNFRNYFRGMENILGPRMTTLLSQTFPHYQLKAGLYTIAGAESSQTGPNAQIRYSFIRGAGKQYGVLWYGNVSVYNRFGHKTYTKQSKGTTSTEPPIPKKKPLKSTAPQLQRNYTCSETLTGHQLQDPAGPQCGTSLNLFKRLMYAHIMYNSGYASFEGGWFYTNDQTDLSPIGLIQHNAYLWTQKFDSFGTYVTTIGVYLDFFNGWAAPRQKHGYEYHVWYNLPYSQGDYLTDEVFRMVYPSYQDCSYFHDETGESSPTPYGDTVDVLLSDTPAWVLNQYDTLVVASNISGGAEVEYNLGHYIRCGGNLVLTAGNLAKLPGGSLGITTNLKCNPVKAGNKVSLYNGKTLIESYNMTVCNIQFPANCTVLARLGDSTPLAVQMPTESGGSLIVFATPFAISSNAVTKPSSQIDVTLPSPYPLLDHARVLLDVILTNATLFTSSANLSLVPTYIDEDHFYLLVSNPELRQQPLKLLSPQGTITSVEEVPLDQSEKGAVGYLPDGFEGTDIGHSTNTTIAGVDTRLFKLTLSSDSLHILPKVKPKPRPTGVALHLRHIDHSIRYEILLRPSFFQHYDSIVVDYSYLITKDEDFLRQESQWLRQQKVSVYVDASPSIDLFPTLRLTDDAPDLYNRSVESLENLLYKMHTLSSHNLILSLHAFPTGQPKNKSLQDFNSTLHHLNTLGSELNITLHMLDTPKNPYDVQKMDQWLLSCNLESIQFVLNTGSLVAYGDTYKYDSLISSRSSLLYVTAPGWDMYGTHYADNLPFSNVNDTIKTEVEEMLEHICTLRECPYPSKGTRPGYTFPTGIHFVKHMENGSGKFYPFVMDAVYANHDEEFVDIHTVENLLLSIAI